MKFDRLDQSALDVGAQWAIVRNRADWQRAWHFSEIDKAVGELVEAFIRKHKKP